jgi:hypothetical protein
MHGMGMGGCGFVDVPRQYEIKNLSTTLGGSLDLLWNFGPPKIYTRYNGT